MYTACLIGFSCCLYYFFFFFFNDTATTEIYTLSLTRRSSDLPQGRGSLAEAGLTGANASPRVLYMADRKSTRLNSSHGYISYAVFCLKKKKNNTPLQLPDHTSTQSPPDHNPTSLDLHLTRLHR